MEWWVYILRCADESLYTGIARDVDRRAAVHNRGQGAKYTRSRLPVTVVWREQGRRIASGGSHQAPAPGGKAGFDPWHSSP